MFEYLSNIPQALGPNHHCHGRGKKEVGRKEEEEERKGKVRKGGEMGGEKEGRGEKGREEGREEEGPCVVTVNPHANPHEHIRTTITFSTHIPLPSDFMLKLHYRKHDLNIQKVSKTRLEKDTE